MWDFGSGFESVVSGELAFASPISSVDGTKLDSGLYATGDFRFTSGDWVEDIRIVEGLGLDDVGIRPEGSGVEEILGDWVLASTPIPEPSPLALFVIGGLAALGLSGIRHCFLQAGIWQKAHCMSRKEPTLHIVSLRIRMGLKV